MADCSRSNMFGNNLLKRMQDKEKGEPQPDTTNQVTQPNTTNSQNGGKNNNNSTDNSGNSSTEDRKTIKVLAIVIVVMVIYIAYDYGQEGCAKELSDCKENATLLNVCERDRAKLQQVLNDGNKSSEVEDRLYDDLKDSKLKEGANRNEIRNLKMKITSLEEQINKLTIENDGLENMEEKYRQKYKQCTENMEKIQKEKSEKKECQKERSECLKGKSEKKQCGFFGLFC